jgi:hypothetical protein
MMMIIDGKIVFFVKVRSELTIKLHMASNEVCNVGSRPLLNGECIVGYITDAYKVQIK